MNYNPIDDRMHGHRAFDDRRNGFPGDDRREGGFPEGPRCAPRGGFRHGNPNRDFGPGFPHHGFDGPEMEGPRCAPRGGFRHGNPNRDFGLGFPRHGFDGPEAEGPRCAPRGFGPGGPGFPPRDGMPPFGGPGGPGFPPRRPNPEFLKRRIEEGDLMELIDMAGRMAHRLPQGGPARGQALVLSILAGREALSQRELQQMLGIQPGSLSELLGKLEAKGLLTREKAEDRRGNLLRITDAGRQAIPEIDADDEDDPLAPLTADQQDQLAGMLRALLTAWVDRLEPAPAAPRGPHGQKPVEV